MQAGTEPFREAFFEALLVGDARRAEIAAREAIDAGLDELSVSEWVIAPALQSVADLSEGGMLDERDEREAAEISMRVLALQREAFRRALERGGEEILLAELGDDTPSARLQAAAHLLRRSGFRVRRLGPGNSLDSLMRSVERNEPDAVVLSVSTRTAGALLEVVLEEIEAARPGHGRRDRRPRGAGRPALIPTG